MRILQINNKYHGAGAENVMQTLGEGLRINGHEVYYATYENISNEYVYKIHSLSNDFLQSFGKINKIKNNSDHNKFNINDPNSSIIKKISLNFRNFLPLVDPIAKKSMQSILNKIKPDIIHCHNILPSLAPLVIAKENNIPTVVTLHGYWLVCPLANRIQIKSKLICDSIDFKKCNEKCTINNHVNVDKYMIKMQRIISNYVDYLIPVSNYVNEKILEYGYPKDKIFTIYNGIDINKYKAENPAVKAQVIHVGRLSLHKGSHIFLKVAEALYNEYPEIKFLLVGSGIKNNLNEHKNLEYLGWISDSQLIKLYGESLCVVIPSQWPEPHPLITLEAMACNTPVIGSNIAGIKETIIDNVTGFLIDLLNEDIQIKSICGKIISLYENKEKRDEMGISARKHTINQFTQDLMVKKYIELYNKLL